MTATTYIPAIYIPAILQETVMRKLFVPVVAAVLAVSAASAQSPRAAAARDDSAAVVAVAAAFHARLVAGDSIGVMAMLAPDAMILEAGGLETRHEYQHHHLPGDIAYAAAVKSVRTVQHVSVRGNMAWIASTSVATGTYKDRAINSTGAELMVLTRQGKDWLVSSVHWSSRARRTN